VLKIVDMPGFWLPPFRSALEAAFGLTDPVPLEMSEDCLIAAKSSPALMEVSLGLDASGWR
jgi:hypothetical protein